MNNNTNTDLETMFIEEIGDRNDTLIDIKCFLVVDEFFKIVSVDKNFLHFHQLFSNETLVKGKSLSKEILISYPSQLVMAIYSVLSERETTKHILVDEGLGRVDSYDVLISQIQLAPNLLGANIEVTKNKPKSTFQITAKSEAFFQELIDHSTSVYQLLNKNLDITYSNKTITEVLGYSSEEVLGRSLLSFIHPDDWNIVKDWIEKINQAPGRAIILEFRIINKKGDFIWIENHGRNMFHHPSFETIVLKFRNIQHKKIADNALVQAEQRLSLLLNNTAESFIILNSRLRIMTYNRAAQDCSPFFYNKELRSGLSVLDLIDESDIQDYITLFEQVFNGVEIEKETKFTDATGELHIYRHIFRPLFSELRDINGVFITSTEVTEQKKLTEKVAINSERLKTAQKIAKLGYLEYDNDSQTFFASEQFYEILEIDKSILSLNELVAFQKNIHPEDVEDVLNAVFYSLRRGSDFNTEFRYNSQLPGSAEKIIVAIGGSEFSNTESKTKFLVTIQDISDSKMAMLALQTLESRFKSLFENSIDGVILSKHTGEILSANPSMCKMLGYTLEEMITLQRTDLLDVDSITVNNMIYRQNTLGEYVGELSFRHKKGHFVPVEITSISLKDANGKDYVSTIVRDITEKKKIEEDQKALTDELMKNNQDLQQFSFITSHNLRAPVANLLSLLSLYNKEKPEDAFNQVLIEKFEQATQQLNQTLNDLVNVLVIKSNNNIEKETINFIQVYLGVRKNIENLLSDKKGKIEVDFTEIEEIQYNKIHIESLFLNMITNAIKYSSPDRKPLIKISSHLLDEWVLVKFKDNGLGMDLKRYGDRLFGLYQRFHGNIDGKGLGLYMTKSQITTMGGKIEVESELGKGTTFNIFFKR